MPAYLVVTRESAIRDQSEIDTYSRMNRESPRDPKLTPLVLYGDLERLEGDDPDAVVVLQFPTMEDARAWYNSPAYQAALVHRRKGADWRAFIVQGL